ncbi:MAG: hypothetical protein ACM3NO_09250 [Deltaproteobacteria bacterium]
MPKGFAARAARRPVEVQIHSKGGQGFGLYKKGLTYGHGIGRFGARLEAQKLLK